MKLWLLLGFFSAACHAQETAGTFQTAFADRLTPAIYGSNPQNACSSSLGISMAFSLISESAADVNVFSTIAMDWSETSDALEATYNGTCLVPSCKVSEPLLLFANSVWLEENRAVNATYEQQLGGDGLIQRIDFGAADSGSTVNEWVNASTNGLIDSIVDDGPLGNIQFIVINSLYLKAAWLEAFETEKTTMDSFFGFTGEQVTPFMHRVQVLPWAKGKLAAEEFEVVQLPFAGSESLSLLLVMPGSNTLIRQTDLIGTVVGQLKEEPIALALPKFTVRSKFGTEAFRQTLGDEIFSEPLCIYEDSCPTISEIIHEAVVEVNEVGVTAAAVTALIGKSIPQFPANPILVQFDRPFQFFVYESLTQLILFEGMVANPMTESESPESTSTHTDEDFWNLMFGVDLRAIPVPPPSMAPTPESPTSTMSVGQTNEPKPSSMARRIAWGGLFCALLFVQLVLN